MFFYLCMQFFCWAISLKSLNCHRSNIGPFVFTDVMVVVVFQEKFYSLECERQMTVDKVREMLFEKLEASPSVAFLTSDDRYVPDNETIAEVLQSHRARTLELYAHHRTTFWLQVFGFEESLAPFEVPAILTPAALRREIERAVDIFTDDFRLYWDGALLDQDLPFDAQGLIEGAKLTLDLRLTVNVNVVRPEGEERRNVTCFGSETVEDLHRQLNLGEDWVLVATSPYRRVLNNSLHLCHIVSTTMDLHLPLELTAEEKILMSFEPITLPHLRQQLPISLSSTPQDLYKMLSEHFEMDTDFRLAVSGEALNPWQPLTDQHVQSDSVIQLDILRPFIVRDQWIDLREIRYEDEVYLYSTASPRGLFLTDFTNQLLTYDKVDLTIFGSVIDVFGPISGQQRAVLLVDRDVERSLPFLSFDAVERKLAWARNMLLDFIPSRALHPKEVMIFGSLTATKRSLNLLHLTGDSLITLDPLKVFVSSEKKLRMLRFARGSTHGDVLRRMQQVKGQLDVGLRHRDRIIMDAEMDQKLDLELYFLMSASRFKTKVMVSLGGKSYGCWFEPQEVSFSDILIDVGKQAGVPPRQLFRRPLFCRGCGRKMSKEEEEFQAIPANCCRVRSLQLSDRRVKGKTAQNRRGGGYETGHRPCIRSIAVRACDPRSWAGLHCETVYLSGVGTQTPGTRRHHKETYTLDPECRGDL